MQKQSREVQWREQKLQAMAAYSKNNVDEIGPHFFEWLAGTIFSFSDGVRFCVDYYNRLYRWPWEERDDC